MALTLPGTGHNPLVHAGPLQEPRLWKGRCGRTGGCVNAVEFCRVDVGSGSGVLYFCMELRHLGRDILDFEFLALVFGFRCLDPQGFLEIHCPGGVCVCVCVCV